MFAAGQTVVGPAGDTADGPLSTLHSDARLSSPPDVQISLHHIKDVSIHPLLMLLFLVDLMRNVNHSFSSLMFSICPFTFQSWSDVTDTQLQTF